MFLDKRDLEDMDLFNNKAEKLRNHNFTKKVKDGFGATISVKNKHVSVEKRFPTDESVESFILTLRFFIQENEASNFKNMAKIYSKLPEYSKEKTAFIKTHKKLNDFLNSPEESVIIRENGKKLTHGGLFDVFLYGELAHANQDKKIKYDIWMSNPFTSAVFQEEFINVTSYILRCILYVQELNESLIRNFTYFKL